MYDHARSDVFNEEFDIEIIESFDTRSDCEAAETKLVSQYDTFSNGLNRTKHGKGHGHNSPKFTTLGYRYSESSRNKMSASAKLRAIREGFETRSKLSKKTWVEGGEEYRKHMSDVRKGKRLRKPKLSDECVERIRKDFKTKEKHYIDHIEKIYEKYTSRAWNLPSAAGLYAKDVHKQYDVTTHTIASIINGKAREHILPCLYQS